MFGVEAHRSERIPWRRSCSASFSGVGHIGEWQIAPFRFTAPPEPAGVVTPSPSIRPDARLPVGIPLDLAVPLSRAPGEDVDHEIRRSLGLFGLLLSVRQGPQALQQLLFLLPGLLPPSLEAPPGLTSFMVGSP
jgi:hypothetical protein